MSIDRTPLKIGLNDNKTEDEIRAGVIDSETDPIVKEALSRAQKKARRAQIVERGFVSSRTEGIDLPPGLYGEWAPIDQIDYYKALGFEFDTQYAKRRAIHSNPELAGQECAVVGDAVFMIQSQEDREIWNEIRHERFMAANPVKTSKEESDFAARTGTLDEGNSTVPVIDKSKTHSVRKEQIISSVKSAIEESAKS